MESILTLISGSHDDKNNQPSPYRPLHLTDVHGVLMYAASITLSGRRQLSCPVSCRVKVD